MSDDDKKMQRRQEAAERTAKPAQGQRTHDVGNVAGQKAAQQSGSQASIDQRGQYGDGRNDRDVGAKPPDATPRAPRVDRDEEVEER